jgi:hypothetical protein
MYVGIQVGLAAALDPSSALLSESVVSTDALANSCPVAAASHESGAEEAVATTSESEVNNESGDLATNSGTISGSQFSDGGFGDIGQQWWNVDVTGDVITVNVANGGTSSIVTGAGGAGAAADAAAVESTTAGTTSTSPVAAAPTPAADSGDAEPPAPTEATVPPTTVPAAPATTAPPPQEPTEDVIVERVQLEWTSLRSATCLCSTKPSGRRSWRGARRS